MHIALRIATYAATGAACFGLGTTASHTTVKTVAGRTVTVNHKVPVPGPTHYKTVIKKVPVPGPTQYKTVYVPASQGPAGTTVANYSGSGTQATGSFSVPGSGDYLVKWSYSGNNDCSLGSCQASNFAITETGSTTSGNMPNEIQASGSGSTEVTGDSGNEAFNVQSAGSWTITVKSLP
jgi:hypothetical protein